MTNQNTRKCHLGLCSVVNGPVCVGHYIYRVVLPVNNVGELCFYTIKLYKVVCGCVSLFSLISKSKLPSMWGYYEGTYVDACMHYVSRNNCSSQLRTTVCDAMRIFYDCSKLRDLRQTSTKSPSYVTNAS